MNRHRSRARDTESRQPEEDGRRPSAASRLLGNLGNNVPRSPRGSSANNNTASSSSANDNNVAMTAPPPPSSAPSTPHSAPPPSNSFPKTRCYRLNLEKPFDISQHKSPLGRDYSGPPIHDSDLPPAQGPVEYIPPMHLCTKEEMAWRRHSWGGSAAGGNNISVLSNGGASTPSELLANLHVSESEESSDDANAPDATSIAITTARIFRGIVVDRNGVITSMNSRATRSQRGKNGGAESKNKIGEKSRQAAKIDKAKDLIDEVAENGGAGGVGDEENDPTKIVSLFVMGEYEDFSDFVRDGSKKLRDSKSLSDETIFMYNRPRHLPPSMQQTQPMAGVSPTSTGVLSPSSAHGAGAMNSSNSNSQYGNPSSPYNGSDHPPTSPSSSKNANPSSSPISNLRKRVFSSEKSRSRYKQVPRSAPPKLKSHPRDTARGGRRTSSSPSHGYHHGNSSVSSAHQYGCNPLGGGHHNNNATTPTNNTSKQSQQQSQQQSSHQHNPNYFQQQCNFFPGNSNWTEALGFSVNSLWNCGANGGTLSPPNAPSSPNSQHHGASPAATGGGVYHGSGAPTGYNTHGTGAHHAHHHHHANPGYHSSTNGYHHPPSSGASGAGYSNGGYNGYSTSPYHGATPAANADEGRNPSYGYGRGASGAGVRDTVVM
mmetsp:Transcript_665/g.1360  ORF Transcript_665/g.1360 Transcript_665/m.1360 type:complete len:657 (-) Transcript_665:167-2137(-)